MSANTKNRTRALNAQAGELWTARLVRLLEELSQGSFDSAACALPADPERTAVRIEYAASAQAEVIFAVDAATRLAIAQIALSEPLNESAEFSADHQAAWQDVLSRLATGWAEDVAAATGERLEVRTIILDAAPPAPGQGFAVRLSSGACELRFIAQVDVAPAGEGLPVTLHSEGEVEPPQHAAVSGFDREPADRLMDVELQATLRFGNREMALRDVLELSSGDVIALDRSVRSPVDLVVGDRIVARGEVVVIDGNYGLRIAEIAEPQHRLEGVRCLF